MTASHETRKAKYHSHGWMCLVEAGWATASVEDGVATMFKVWYTN